MPYRRQPLFRRKRPTIDGMLLQRNQMFIRHPDRRLLIVTSRRLRTFVSEWRPDGDIVNLATLDAGIAFDGSGWDLRALIVLLDGVIGRVCGHCGTRIAHNRLYCSKACRQASYRARNGK